jgi:membrane fusion protein (multidrug efflux system)
MTDLRYSPLCSAVVLIVALTFATESRAQVPATPVVMRSATVTTLVESADAVGYVHADREAPIRAETAERIVEVRVKDGAKVAKGDILFRLDDTVELVQLKSAKLNHDVKKAALDRVQKLIRKSVVAASKLPDARAQVVLALVEVEKAELALEHTRIRAPFDGVLGALRVEVGDYAPTSEALTTIYKREPLQVRFRMPQRKLGRLVRGQSVVVRSSSFPDHRHTGRIVFISPALDPATKSVEVKAVLEPAAELQPGMFVSISVALSTIEQAVTVPDEALVPTAKGFVLFLVVDGKAKMTAVEVGLRDGNRVQIKKGASAGDKVVVEGQLKLRDGVPVVAAAAPAAVGKGSGK